MAAAGVAGVQPILPSMLSLSLRPALIVSPRLRSRLPPQQTQMVGPGTITRSRGRCSGNGLRAGRLRVNAVTAVVFATAFSAAISSSVAELSSSSNCNSI